MKKINALADVIRPLLFPFCEYISQHYVDQGHTNNIFYKGIPKSTSNNVRRLLSQTSNAPLTKLYMIFISKCVEVLLFVVVL